MSLPNKKTLCLPIAFAVVCNASVIAQPPDTLWTRTYGGWDSDFSYSLIESAKNVYVIVGSSMSYGNGNLDVYVIMTDFNGDTLWTRTYGGENYDVGYSIIETPDLEFVIAGVSASFGQHENYYEGYIVKIDFYGDTLWTRVYDLGFGWCWFHSIDLTNDGGLIVAGDIYVSQEQDTDIILVKFDQDGLMRWMKTYGDGCDDTAWSVVTTDDNGFILTGKRESDPYGVREIFILKTDSQGDSIWAQTIAGENFLPMEARSVKQTDDGGYIVSGHLLVEMNEYYINWDIYLIRLDEHGAILWVREFGGDDIDWSFDVLETFDGGFFITGQSFSYSNGPADMWLIKTDPEGIMQWSTNIRGYSDEVGLDALVTSDGNYLASGITLSYGEGLYDVYLVKLEGDQTPITDSRGSPGSLDAFLHQNYPNPFNASTTISYTISDPQYVRLTIYDLLGREVRMVIDKREDAGTHCVNLDASRLAGGIYFYRLNTSNYSDVRQFTIIK